VLVCAPQLSHVRVESSEAEIDSDSLHTLSIVSCELLERDAGSFHSFMKIRLCFIKLGLFSISIYTCEQF
jgi:hypothetical protein